MGLQKKIWRAKGAGVGTPDGVKMIGVGAAK